MPSKIHFFNQAPVKYQLKHKTTLREWIARTIETEKRTLVQLNYIFCDDEFLLALNKLREIFLSALIE